ncbi:MAG: elongation factor P [Gammaproteobacteria bacterium]|nr:elongation factor P [Gammaproteobacteria bacterium]
MVTYSTSDFKVGLKIIIDKDPCVIIEEEFNKPGKGQAFNKIKYRNYLTGRVGEKTCKVGESLEAADVEELEMQFLYSDGSAWFFMHPVTYDQIPVSTQIVGELDQWVTEEDICKVLLWNEKPILVIPPNFVDLIVLNTDPGVKGDTATGGSKPATLSTGAIIKVPLFVSEGETVTVDTRNGEYQGRK